MSKSRAFKSAGLISVALWIIVSWASMAQASTVILNETNSFLFEIESGATISQPGLDGFNPPGEGALLGTNLVFALGPADTADFSLSDTVLGRRLAGDNPDFFIRPRDIIGSDIQIAILVGSSGNIYNLDILSWVLDRGECVGLCTESGGRTSFNLEIVPVPLPAALPLLAAGLSAMGYMGWRRKRSA